MLAWIAVPITIGIRLWFDATHAIVPDEGVYWNWSRHLAGGYLDHPSGIAFIIRLSTLIFGQNELGVRFFAALMAGGSAAVAMALAGRLFRSGRCVDWVALLLLGSPLVMLLGTIITPDTPAIFFSISALACVILASEPDISRKRFAWLWLAAGLLTGLALLTKYTSVLLPFSVLMALLFSSSGRSQLARPWPYVAGVLALLVFFPVVHWNATHDWVSFKFQLNHGLATDSDVSISGSDAKPSAGGFLALLSHTSEYIGGQFGVWNPVLLGLAMVAVVAAVWRYRSLPLSRQLLIWAGIVPLVFFGVAASRARGEINWPSFAYFPLTLLTVEYAILHTTPRRLAWLKIGTTVAIVIALGLNLPTVLMRLGVRPSKFDQLSGWPAFSAQLEATRNGLPVVCNMQREAGEIEFYLPGQPRVLVSSGGARPAAYDYMDDRPDFRSFPMVAYVGDHHDVFCRKFGFAKVGQDGVRVPLETGRDRARTISFLQQQPMTRPVVSSAVDRK